MGSRSRGRHPTLRPECLLGKMQLPVSEKKDLKRIFNGLPRLLEWQIAFKRQRFNGIWVTSSKTKVLNIPLNVHGFKTQEGNRLGSVFWILQNSKCLKNFYTYAQTQPQRLYQRPGEVANVMGANPSSLWAAVPGGNGSLSWDPLLGG